MKVRKFENRIQVTSYENCNDVFIEEVDLSCFNKVLESLEDNQVTSRIEEHALFHPWLGCAESKHLYLSPFWFLCPISYFARLDLG